MLRIENLDSSMCKAGFNVVLTFSEKCESMKPRVVQRDPYRALCYDVMGVNKTIDRQPLWSVFLSSIFNLHANIPNNKTHAFIRCLVSVIKSLPGQNAELLCTAYNAALSPFLRTAFCVIRPLEILLQGVLARREGAVAEARLE